jgi:type I restriction enzyme R subunit
LELKKQDLGLSGIDRIKAVAVGLLAKLKAEKLRVDQWRDKKATRDAIG